LEILRHKGRKRLVSPPHPCLIALLRGNLLEFLDENYLAKTKRDGATE